MAYQKISKLLDAALPKEKPPLLPEAQLAALKSVANIALAVVAAMGVLGIAIVAPNLFVALDKLAGIQKKTGQLSPRQKREKAVRAFYYLKRKGLIRFEEDKGIVKVVLSKLGQKQADKLQLAGLSVPRAKRWDGKWWQVAADIPTKDYRQGADLFRRKLKDMGFYSLQRTLWFYPFDPRKEIEFVCASYGIGRFVTVMEVNRLDTDDERKLKLFFQL